jgi:hypothetical protein
MACTGRFASAWEFSAFNCPSSLLKGQDRLGGAPHADLTDTQANFVQGSIKANMGMVLYNLTTGLSGPVTAVITTTLTATGVTWTIGDLYRVAALTGVEIASIESILDIAASDLHAALARANACSCTFAVWATQYLAKLNIIDAASFYNCTCGGTGLSDEMKRAYMDWVTNQLELIGTGKLELCAGATGSDFPSIDWAESSATAFAAAEILINRTP